MTQRRSREKQFTLALALGFFVLLLLSVLGYWSWSKREKTLVRSGVKTELSPNEPTYLSSAPSFHPDSVTGLKWGNGEKLLGEVRRRERDAEWKGSEVATPFIQERLNLLAVVHGQATPTPQKSVAYFEVEFSNEQVWRAEFDGQILHWVKGGQAEQGSVLLPQDQVLLWDELTSRERRHWYWCPDRPIMINPQMNDANAALTWEKDHWSRYGRALSPELQNQLETWLSQWCQVEVSARINASRFEAPKTWVWEKPLQIGFSNQGVWTFQLGPEGTALLTIEKESQRETVHSRGLNEGMRNLLHILSQ